MKTITLYTVSPAGSEEEEYGRMEKFAEELNRFYKKFNNLHVELTAYGMTLPVRKDGKYAVKVLQNPVITQVRKSALCCVIFFCKKEEVAPDEMNLLIRSMTQLKKAEFMVYFKPNEDMQPVRNDIMRRIVQIDEKMGVPREDRKRLSDMAKNFINIGCSLDRENRQKEAEGAYKEALVIQRKLVKADEEAYLPDLALPYHNLGTLYFRTNRLKEAEAMYAEALRIRKQLLEKKGDIYLPLVAASGMNMGALYIRTDRLEEAERIYKEVLEIREQLAAKQPENAAAQLQLSDICGNLGSLYSKMKQPEEAEKNFSRTLDIQKKLLEDMEKEIGEDADRESEQEEIPAPAENTSEEDKKKKLQQQAFEKDVKKKAAMVGNTLGVLYLNQKRMQEAEEKYLLSYRFYSELAEKEPNEFEPPLCMVSFNLYNIYRGMKKPDQAAPYLEKAQEISEARKDTDPLCKQIYDSLSQAMKAAAEKQAEIAGLLKKQGQEHRDNGRYEDAIKSYQQAAQLYKGMEQQEYQSEAALLYNELGLLNWDIDHLEEAEDSYRSALELYRRIAENDESRLADVAIASYNMGRFRQETRDEEVNEYLREAFEIAGRCREDNEQCRDIYENLEDEPLYGEPSNDESLCDEPEGSSGTAQEDKPADGRSSRLEAENAESHAEAQAGEEKKSWWQKLWKK